jgi:RNA polymerase sigma-70 factor (ECF subfamily)
MTLMAAGTATASPADDQLLTRAIHHGDRDALNELFRRYRSVAYRVAYRLLGNEADALDAVQEAFVKALTHLDGFQGRSSFKTWLLRVVGNAALDLGRQRSRREAIRLDGLSAQTREEMEPMVFEDAGRDLERADMRRILQQALDQLPVAQRQTFVLHAEAGLSYREVASVLDISIGTVMSRLYYTRQRLRALLEAWTRT